MDLMEVLKARRSIGLVKEDAVSRDLIEQILEAGTYAPNHHRTEPWRFFVLEGDARNRLGDVLAEITQSTCTEPPSEDDLKKIERQRKNPLRAPVIIAVGVEPTDKKNVILQEEHAAVHAAVQNMLLAIHALGLGAVWRTGPICYDKKVKDFFKLSPQGELVAFLYIGYPNMEPGKKIHKGFEEHTTWME